ncbi:MAG: hypothetical protein G01um10142_180 [Parcubacteria group bacterium Gr01-1014_2]|nr:MAG: hypothetical protein G01um10142_180 [Parcubacteria group bacterium Gr01-1014_2]
MRRNLNRGFTLIEVIVSVLIISFVTTGALFAITLSLSSAAKIRNNLIAATLAQEGLEIVRGIRDQDWHLGNSFGASLSNGSYVIDWSSQSLAPFSDTFIKKDANGFYNYTSGTDTIFKRKIIIENSGQNPSTVEKVIKVEVSWLEKANISKMIQAEDRLFNWQ